MERQKLIEKIKKLREHSVENGATETEALAFALKAQKLIADNGIEEWELGEECGREVVEIESRTKVRRAWRKMLAAVVAENFRCKSIINIHPTGSGREHVPTFVGYRQDAEAAALVYEHLLEVGDRLGRQHEDDYYTVPDAYENFVMGFTSGVSAELEKQCEALMLVCPQEVGDYLDGLNLRKGRRPRRVAMSIESQRAGEAAGRDAVRSRRMEAGTAGLPAA